MSLGAAGATGSDDRGWLSLFSCFAGIYFFSAMLRAVTATLAPNFSVEFSLGAADLGLLAGAFFLGFSLLQLPLGAALDRFGARRVESCLLIAAVLGCVLFAGASSFAQLVVARAVIGMGVAGCLMAPLTFFRQRFSPALQWRCNSWMLMSGSLGMVASTLPVQWLLPHAGWRGLFWGLAAGLALAAVWLLWRVPDTVAPPLAGGGVSARYREVLRNPQFRRMAPLGCAQYGGMIALQTLWIGPWLTQVCGWTPYAASQGLLLVNSGMLLAFLVWGWAMPHLSRRGITVEVLLSRGLLASLALLAINIWLGAAAVAWHWMLWCVVTSVVALTQPAVGQAMPVQMAGRALSAFNLAVFAGVFSLQWGIGVAIDALSALGVDSSTAFRVSFAGLFGLCLAGFTWYRLKSPARTDNAAAVHAP